MIQRFDSGCFDRHVQVEFLLHLANRPLLIASDEADDRSGGPGTGSAPRPVKVVLVVPGQIEVDNGGDGVDVNAAGCDVRGDQCLGTAGGELFQCPVALGL